MTRKFTRREVVKILGGGGILLFSGACTKLRRKIQDELDYFTEHKLAMEKLTGEWEDGALWINREERFINTTCMMCDSRCGLVARSINSDIVFVRGNPDHPVNLGGICPLGVAGLQYQYSPDRIINPLQRQGERGGGLWENIGVRKAIDIIDGILKQVSGSRDSIVFITDEHDTARAIAIKSFMKNFDSYRIVSSNYDKNLRYSIKRLLNVDSTPIYDIENSDYILSFGYDFLSYADNFMHYQTAYSRFRSNPAGRGRHVQIDSHLSLTAGKSDWWIPVNPGTEHILARGIIYVLLRERLYNSDFAQEFFKGFDSFTREVLKGTELEYVSKKTGVSTSIIVRLAKELAIARRPVAIPGPQLYFSENAGEKLESVFFLNLLLGRFETPGGMLLEDNSVSREIEDSFLENYGKKIEFVSYEFISRNHDFFKDKVLFITENNPYRFAGLNPDFITGLKKARFICYWGQYHNDISELSDIIMPDRSFVERDDISLASRGFKFPVISVVKKIIDTSYETFDLSQFVFERGLGMRRGNPDWNAFIREIQERIFALRRGEVFVSDRRKSVVDILESQGFWYHRYKNKDEFFKELENRGAWWDPYYNYGEYGSRIRTDDRKIDLSVLFDFRSPSEEEEKDYPLRLVPLLNSYIGIDGRGADIPWILELTGMRINHKWGLWAEINPATARELGIEDGEVVRLRSKNGQLEVKIRYFEGCIPGCVNIPVGAGNANFGRWAREYNGFAYSLFGNSAIFGSDSPLIFSTKVRIEKI